MFRVLELGESCMVMRFKDVGDSHITAELLADLIRERIKEDTGVDDKVFEQHVFDTEKALGIKVYEVSGSLSERWGYKPYKHISNDDLEEDFENWQRHFKV